MPGAKSLEHNQYYAHPRNGFWKIICAIHNEPYPEQYESKLAVIKKHHLAIWDVLQYCRRKGSLDSSIKQDDIKTNDIAGFLKQHQSISKICFNGKKANELFNRYIIKANPNIPQQYELVVLPSTSPANAKLSANEKQTIWQQQLFND